MADEARAAARAASGLYRRGSSPGPIEVQVIGIGATGVPEIRRSDTSCIVLAGLGGALDPALDIGDVVIEGWSGPLPGGDLLRAGRICCQERIAGLPAEKAAIFSRTGCAVVDMESDPVRQAAQAAGIPLVLVRAVLDRADQSLTPALANMVDARGQPRLQSLARAVACCPSLLWELMRLARNRRIALRQLGRALDRLLRWPGLWSAAEQSQP